MGGSSEQGIGEGDLAVEGVLWPEHILLANGGLEALVHKIDELHVHSSQSYGAKGRTSHSIDANELNQLNQVGAIYAKHCDAVYVWNGTGDSIPT